MFQRLFHFVTNYKFIHKKPQKTQEEINLLNVKEKTKYYSDASSWIKELIQLRTAVQLLYEVFNYFFFNLALLMGDLKILQKKC